MSEVPDISGLVVALATYRRADELARTLRTILAQIDEVGLGASVLVVDNDPAASARGVIAGLDSPRVRYVVEPNPGIAAARNRAISESHDQHVLIFIDDDEDPQDGWLSSLLKTYVATTPVAVVGPVVSEFEGELDSWIRTGGFFERRRLATGTRVDAAATNNLLLDLDRIRALGLRFDERFGLSGGSDTLFTRQLSGAGGSIVWCDEAVVVDHVPAGRMTREWVLRRAMRYGNSWSRTSLALTEGRARRMVVRIEMVARGLIRIAGGAGRFGVGFVFRSERHRARGLRTLMKGVGYVMGAGGGVYVEYSRTGVSSNQGSAKI